MDDHAVGMMQYLTHVDSLIGMACTKVQQFYSNKSVFLTGVTGTLGTVILYLLLVSFPDIGTIFVLIRNLKDKDSAQRLSSLLNNEVFSSVSTEQKNKVKVVPGNIEHENLSLGDMTHTVLDSTDIVIHAAADVRFGLPLQSAIRTNVFGTEAVMKLFLDSSKLKSFVYVSTAFINPEQDILEEKVYKLGISAAQVQNVLESKSENDDRTMENRIIGDKKTSYCFSKCLAEDLVADYSASIPSAIVRVPLVSPSLKEPSPGYFNSTVGFNGFLVASASGFLKYFCLPRKNLGHVAPVDICATNVLLAAAVVGEKRNPLLVFNVANTKATTWKNFFNIANQALKSNVKSPLLWTPHLTLVESRIVFYLLTFFFVLVPALVCDLFTMIDFKTPRASYFCFKAFDRVRISREVLQPNFKMKCENAVLLTTLLQPEDKHLQASFAAFDLKSYCESFVNYFHKFINHRQGNELKTSMKNHSHRSLRLEVLRLLIFPTMLIAAACIVLVLGFGLYEIKNLVVSKVE